MRHLKIFDPSVRLCYDRGAKTAVCGGESGDGIMIRTKKPVGELIIAAALCVLIGLYVVGIIWVNLNSGQWYNFDIYADAMVAKYMAEEGTLFPHSWIFGNQLYVVATPVLAALMYSLCADTVLSLGIASCIMTALIILSFWWCVRPFAKMPAVLTGLLCLIGGTLFSYHAARDSYGLQLFYTMGSYYACYVIGIFFTLGIWLRLMSKKKVSFWLIAGCFLLNLGLGMQSVREMLVLNIPLCALALGLTFLDRKSGRKAWMSESNLFAAAMFTANFSGITIAEVLVRLLPIHENSILGGAGIGLEEKLRNCILMFLDYIGVAMPDGTVYSVFKLCAALILVGIVAATLVSVVKNRNREPIACAIIFCALSLSAVFCVGVLVIYIRAIYFFVWQLLLAFSMIYWMERLPKGKAARNVLLVFLILLSGINLVIHFRDAVASFGEEEDFYERIADTLKEDGITHFYYDGAAIFNASRIAACSDDRIVCGSFHLNPEGAETGDLLNHIGYLCSSDWFRPENRETSYLLLSGQRLEVLEQEQYQPLRDALFAHLTLEHHFTSDKADYYFYSFTEELYSDMISQ